MRVFFLCVALVLSSDNEGLFLCVSLVLSSDNEGLFLCVSLVLSSDYEGGYFQTFVCFLVNPCLNSIITVLIFFSVCVHDILICVYVYICHYHFISTGKETKTNLPESLN